MKNLKFFLFLALFASFSLVKGQSNLNSNVTLENKTMEKLEVIKLSKPNLERGVNVMQAFSQRKSDRVYVSKALSLADLSDLLWAANGINRIKEGKRTAPSAMNVQDVDIYVILKEGAYIYDAKNYTLSPVAAGDYRSLVASKQEFAASAPVSLVLVSDISRFGAGDSQSKQIMGAYDVGIVSQNISIFCAGVGLGTVPRATMDKAKLKSVLKLSDTQILMLNHPVGYLK